MAETRTWTKGEPEPEGVVMVRAGSKAARPLADGETATTWLRTERGWYCTNAWASRPNTPTAYATWRQLVALWGPLTELVPPPTGWRLERKQLLDLVADFVDPDECEYDHHRYCQTHGLHGEPCPHARAKALLAEVADVQS